jgi:hypothetical protein
MEKLQGGALIIGSLLWQDHLGRRNTIRKDWRRKHLIGSRKLKVLAPMRYGRLSDDDVFTMVFANSVRYKSGHAFIVPFKNNFTDVRQLAIECSELSKAEGLNGRFLKSTKGAPWCVLGILFNKKKISKKDRDEISGWWEKQLKTDEDYRRFDPKNFRLGSETPCIHQNGLLNFPWIKSEDPKQKTELAKYDFVIATATLPSKPKYPSIKKMAVNVKKDTGRLYFKTNNDKEITTFQDDRILALLNKNDDKKKKK